MGHLHRALGRFTVTSWSESLVSDIDGQGSTVGETYSPTRGLTRVEARYAYSGEIEGTSEVVYLIAYHAGAAPVLGFERFTGSIGGHDGTCVFRHAGTQDKASVTACVEVVSGMGTGGLETLRGEAELSIAGHSEDGYPLALSFDLG